MHKNTVGNSHDRGLKFPANSRLRPREDLVTQATEWLKQQILDGTFAVGGDLPAEGDLATQLGVSRTVIRESMRNLRIQGLIEISQGRRPRVKPPDSTPAANALEMLIRRSQSTSTHLMQVRIPLETEIAALAAQNRSEEGIVQMAGAIEQLKRAENVEARIVADVAFHRLLSEATGNAVFALIIGSIMPFLQTFQSQTYRNVGVDHAVSGHSEILQAVQRRDPDAARSAMLAHLAIAFQDLKNDDCDQR